jgi:disulfide bond formation protein DsbB
MPEGSGFKLVGQCALAAVAMALPILALGGWVIAEDYADKERAAAAYREAAQAWERVAAAPAADVLPADVTAHGRDVFMSACITCHGADGRGVPSLGKDLTQSDFVALQSDTALTQFLATGRPNAKPLPMPAKGGRDDLTDADLAAVTRFIRGLQDPRRMPSLPAYAAAAPAPATQAEKDAALAAAGGDAELAEFIASGSKLYTGTCIACHGPNGSGIKGNGKPLARNTFVASMDDDALLAFIKRGRDPSDPKNTTGVGMPAKGGNPALSDDDLLDIIAFIRTLQAAPGASASAKN